MLTVLVETAGMVKFLREFEILKYVGTEGLLKSGLGRQNLDKAIL